MIEGRLNDALPRREWFMLFDVNSFKIKWCVIILVLITAASFGTSYSMARTLGVRDNEATHKYLAAIAQRAKKVYFPLQGFEACRSSVRFLVDCRGAVSSIKVEEHPYHFKTHATAPLADSALICDVENLHLPPPPPDLGCPISIQLVFDGRGGGQTKILPQVIETGAVNGISRKAVRKSEP